MGGAWWRIGEDKTGGSVGIAGALFSSFFAGAALATGVAAPPVKGLPLAARTGEDNKNRASIVIKSFLCIR